MSVSKPPLDELRIERVAERQPESKTWMAVATAAIVLVLVLVAMVWHSRSGGIVVHMADRRPVPGHPRRAPAHRSRIEGTVIHLILVGQSCCFALR